MNNDGIHIYFEITGSGAPLILQHGLSDSIAGWRESGLVERLQDRHRLIMIDAAAMAAATSLMIRQPTS